MGIEMKRRGKEKERAEVRAGHDKERKDRRLSERGCAWRIHTTWKQG